MIIIAITQVMSILLIILLLMKHWLLSKYYNRCLRENSLFCRQKEEAKQAQKQTVYNLQVMIDKASKEAARYQQLDDLYQQLSEKYKILTDQTTEERKLLEQANDELVQNKDKLVETMKKIIADSCSKDKLVEALKKIIAGSGSQTKILEEAVKQAVEILMTAQRHAKDVFTEGEKL